MLFRRDERVVHHGNYQATRIAIGIASGVKLFEENSADAWLLFELASSCVHQRFAAPNEAAGNGPNAHKRLCITLDQHDSQGLLFEIQAKDHAINRQPRPFVLVLKRHNLLSVRVTPTLASIIR